MRSQVTIGPKRISFSFCAPDRGKAPGNRLRMLHAAEGALLRPHSASDPRVSVTQGVAPCPHLPPVPLLPRKRQPYWAILAPMAMVSISDGRRRAVVAYGRMSGRSGIGVHAAGITVRSPFRSRRPVDCRPNSPAVPPPDRAPALAPVLSATGAPADMRGVARSES